MLILVLCHSQSYPLCSNAPRFERLECVVFGSAEKGGELPLVDAVVIHLLVMEPGRADELVRLEVREELCTQARIGRQWPVLGQPL